MKVRTFSQNSVMLHEVFYNSYREEKAASSLFAFRADDADTLHSVQVEPPIFWMSPVQYPLRSVFIS